MGAGSSACLMSDIEIRPLRREDFSAVQDIVRKTWDFDKMTERKKEAADLSAVYLTSCIGSSVYRSVACVDGRVVGVIMGRCQKPPLFMPREYWGIFLKSVAGAACSGRCRRLARLFGGFSKLNEALLKNCHQAFDGEICLFAVAGGYRGKGIGVKLFEDMKDYLRRSRARNFYLFTDTSCTYEFYDRHGMLRLGEKAVDISGQAFLLPESACKRTGSPSGPKSKVMYLYIYGASL